MNNIITDGSVRWYTLFLPQHTVRLVPQQGRWRSQWQRRCWMSLFSVPDPQLLPQAPHAAVRGSRQAAKHTANPRLPSVCTWPIPCEELCPWPIRCFHTTWPSWGAGVGQEPCWVQGLALEEPAACGLVWPPCFGQCQRKCKSSLAVQVGSYSDW